MPLWYVPITITEYGRMVLVEAQTKQDAVKVAKTIGWNEATNASYHKVLIHTRGVKSAE